MPKPTTTTTEAPDAAWLSVADAARVLGITPRAVQKRAAAGKIGARKIGGGAAARWEIDAHELSANRTANQGANCEPKDANREPTGREPLAVSGASERESGREPRTDGREPGANLDANREPKRELSPEREAEMRAEIGFLRNVIEQLQRDSIETRAALREALKLAPKQLNAAPESANSAPQRAPTGAADTDSPTSANGSQKAPDARESAPITYDSIADEIERMMEKP